MRADFYPDTDDATIDPRFAVRYDVTENTAVKGGDRPLLAAARVLDDGSTGVGNPELEPYRATQTSLGVEQRFGPLKLGLEGFYKWLENRVVSTPGGEPPYFVNDGEGRIVGGELSAEFAPQAGTFGYLGYTLSRSERRDLDGEWRPFDQDQTHILSVAAGHELGAGWNLGARFRYVTGNPATPVTGSVYDARSGVYVPDLRSRQFRAQSRVPSARRARRESIPNRHGKHRRLPRSPERLQRDESGRRSLQLRLPPKRARFGSPHPAESRRPR